MKNHIKRTVSIFLSLLMIIMLFTIVPFEAGAATYGDWEYRLEDDFTCTITKYNGTAKTVTVPATIYGNKVITIASAFEGNKSIQSVTISHGIKNIDRHWTYGGSFDGCTNLKSVSIPNTVELIGDWSFRDCVNLESVIIPSSVKIISGDSFENCKKLKSVTLKEGLKTIGESAFLGCESLNSIAIPNSVEKIETLAFTGCTSLKTITIGSGLEYIAWDNEPFMPWNGVEGTSSLESITVNANNSNFCSVNGILYNKNKTKLLLYPQSKKDKEYLIPNTVTDIATNSVIYNPYMTEVTVPRSIRVIPNELGYVKELSEGYYSGSGITKKSNFTIKGYKGTEAEKYARNNDFKFVEIVEKPAAPTVSVANGINGLDVAWNKVINAQSYIVYYKTATSGWSNISATGTKTTLPKVQSGKLYYVQVQSIGANGVTGNYSKVRSMTYLSRAVITSLTYNGNNTLKWNAVSGANNYQIARLKTGDKTYSYFYSTSPTLTEKNATGGIAYTYQVRAMYQTTNNGTAYGAWSTAKSVATLVAPTVTLSNKSNGIRVTWNSIRGTKKYIVYYKKSTDASWSSVTTTNLYYPLLNVTRGSLYYVQVRPIGSSVNGPYSKVKSITFK